MRKMPMWGTFLDLNNHSKSSSMPQTNYLFSKKTRIRGYSSQIDPEEHKLLVGVGKTPQKPFALFPSDCGRTQMFAKEHKDCQGSWRQRVFIFVKSRVISEDWILDRWWDTIFYVCGDDLCWDCLSTPHTIRAKLLNAGFFVVVVIVMCRVCQR